MRIIAGQWKGRRLESPPGAHVRPTSDRLRETLFNVLAPVVAGARVLDGFAGTGAIGLEALSRGAAAATFVERDARVCKLLERNVAMLGAGGAVTVLRREFERIPPPEDDAGRFELVLLDPPYAWPDLPALTAHAGPFVAPGGQLVLEHARRVAAPEAAGPLRRSRTIEAGDSALSFYRAP